MKTEEELNLRTATIYAAGGVAAFHLAYHSTALALMIGFYLFAVASLLRLRTARSAFYFGAAVGFGVYAPPLEFFWTIFGPAALALWAVLAFWHGLFVAVARQCRVRFGWQWAVLLLPFLWTGIEYFRSEVYHLRFSWLSAGFAFADSELYSPFRWLGVYGIGFLLMTLVSGLLLAQRCRALMACGLSVAVAGLLFVVPDETKNEKGRVVRVAGIQMEFPLHAELMAGLDRLAEAEPDAELIVLSEYTFPGAIPKDVKEWCRTNQRFLIVGGKEETDDEEFYNTAFVIGPEGKVVFKQAKSVPIQFMQDGLPAERQKIWHSPWGKLGIGICYDLSYRDVMDQFVEQGAEALIIPTMDVQDWGKEQHDLHARVAPMRSMEYGLPIVRLASSGVSQLTTPEGVVEADAPFPGQHRILSGRLKLNGAGVIPVDRFLAPLSCFITAALVLFLLLEPIGKRLFQSAVWHADLHFDPKPALRMLAFPWQVYPPAHGAHRQHRRLQIRRSG